MQGGNTLHTCCVSKSMQLPDEVKAATAIMATHNGNLRWLNSSGPAARSPIRPGSPLHTALRVQTHAAINL